MKSTLKYIYIWNKQFKPMPFFITYAKKTQPNCHDFARMSSKNDLPDTLVVPATTKEAPGDDACNDRSAATSEKVYPPWKYTNTPRILRLG